MPLVKLALEAHHFRRKLVAFQSRADLVGNSFDQSDFVIFKTAVALLAPDKTQKPERLTADAHRRDQSGVTVQLRIENQANRKRQILINQAQSFSFAQNVAQNRKRLDVERLIMFLNHLQNRVRLDVRRGFKRSERDFFSRLVKDA